MKTFLLIMSILCISGGLLNSQTITMSMDSPNHSPLEGYSEAKYPMDTANLLVYYTYSFIRDTTEKRIHTDRCILEIGSRYMHYYSLLADKADSNLYLTLRSRASKNSEKGINPSAFLKPDEFPNQDQYWFDSQNDSLQVFDMIVKQPYTYKEPTPVFDWVIHSDTLHVLGYVCQLATTRFRGRNYRVWFTFEIPIPYGPWKFNGLPGLILKAQTDDGNFDFLATGIEVPKRRHPIYELYYYFRYITRQEMMTLYRMSYEDPAALFLSHGVFFTGTTGQVTKKRYEPGEFSFPYVPFLELE